MIEIHQINQDISIGILDLGAFSIQWNIQKKRESETRGTRFLIEQLLPGNVYELCYTAENKPFLKGREEHISITHSHEKLAIILNRKENTGIDIELIRDKVLQVTHKFLNDHETEFASGDVEKLITLWAAKEALYKVYGLKGVDFRTNLLVEAPHADEFTGRVMMNGTQKSYRLVRQKIGNYMLVYVKHEI